MACIQIQSRVQMRFSGHFFFPHLSTLPRPDFPGSHGANTCHILTAREDTRRHTRQGLE